jgi:hypothetical protein
MEYSEQQLQEFKERYARRRRNHYLVSGAAVLVAIGFGLAAQSSRGHAIADHPVYLALLLAFVLVAVVFTLRNWRCPACGAMLGRAWRVNFCHSCGVALR